MMWFTRIIARKEQKEGMKLEKQTTRNLEVKINFAINFFELSAGELTDNQLFDPHIELSN